MTGNDDDVWGAGVRQMVALKKLQPVGDPPVKGREEKREGGRVSDKRSSKSLLSGKEGEC